MNEEKINFEDTVIGEYETLIFDLDGTLWNCFKPDGTGEGAYATNPPYKLQDKDHIIDINGYTIVLQEGVREFLSVLYDNDINLGILSKGEKFSDLNTLTSVPFESQPSVMLLKKFDIYKYFNYDIILKGFVNKSQYLKPLGRTLFIDDEIENILDVDNKGQENVDVVKRQSFNTWLQLLQLKRNVNSKLSWQLEDDFVTEETNEYGDLFRKNSKGQFHSLYSPAIEYSDGSKAWYQNDLLHRLDGPAVEYPDGHKVWYQNGKLHRLDGPAIEWSNSYKEWWYEDEWYGNSKEGYTQEGYNQEKFEEDLRNEGKIASQKLSWNTEEMQKFSDYDETYWVTFIVTFVKAFVEEQTKHTPDLGNKKELAKDAVEFMMDEHIPQNIKDHPDFLNWLQKAVDQLEREGYGNVLGPREYQPPQDTDVTFQNQGEGGEPVDPSGQGIDEVQDKDDSSFYLNLNNILKNNYYSTEDLIDEYLDKMNKAQGEGNIQEVNKIKEKLHELQSLSSKLSWYQAPRNFSKVKLDGSTHRILQTILNNDNLIRQSLLISSLGIRFQLLTNLERGNYIRSFIGDDTRKYIELTDNGKELLQYLDMNNATSSIKLAWGEEDFIEEERDEYGNIYRVDKNGDFHSLYSPAVEASNGYKAWYQNGKLYRLDGPAREYANGSKAWYYEDEYYGNSREGYNQEQFEEDLRNEGKIASQKLSWGEEEKIYTFPVLFPYKPLENASNGNGYTAVNILKKAFNDFLEVNSIIDVELLNIEFLDADVNSDDDEGGIAFYSYTLKCTRSALENLELQIDEYNRNLFVPYFELAWIEGEGRLIEKEASQKLSWGEEDFVKEYEDDYGDLVRKNDKGELHSLYSPAIEAFNGSKYWCQNDKLHRLDGPAIEWSNSYKEWWYEGKFYGNCNFSAGYNQEQFEQDLKDQGKIASVTNKFNTDWQITRLKAKKIKSPSDKLNFVYDFLLNNLSKENIDRVLNWLNTTSMSYKDQDTKELFSSFIQKIKELTPSSEDIETPLSEVSVEELDQLYKDLNKRKYNFQFNKIPQSHTDFVNNIKEELNKRSFQIDQTYSQDPSDSTDIQPTEVTQNSPSSKRENNNLLKNKLDFNYEKTLFEKGLHQDLDESNDFRPITPYGSTEPNFDYIKDREDQIFQFEPDNTPGLDTMDMQQSYNTDLFLPELEHDKKENDTSTFDGKENLLLWASQKLSWQLEDDFTEEYRDSRGTVRRKNDLDQLHSLYSPAIEAFNGSKYWCQNDKLHRLDGPAVENSTGYKAWYYEDQVYGDSENGYTQEKFEQDLKDQGKIASSKTSSTGEEMQKFSEYDEAYWVTFIVTFVKAFVEEQMKLTPDLGNKDELAKDAIEFMMDEHIPENIKNDTRFLSWLQKAREQLEQDGYGDILGPKSITPLENVDLSFENQGEGGEPVDPSGQGMPEEQEKDDSAFYLNLNNILKNNSFTTEDLIDDYLDKLNKAQSEGNIQEVNKIKEQLQELQSLSSKISFSDISEDTPSSNLRVVNPIDFSNDYVREAKDRWGNRWRLDKNNKHHSLSSPAYFTRDGRCMWIYHGKTMGWSEFGYTQEKYEDDLKRLSLGLPRNPNHNNKSDFNDVINRYWSSDQDKKREDKEVNKLKLISNPNQESIDVNQKSDLLYEYNKKRSFLPKKNSSKLSWQLEDDFTIEYVDENDNLIRKNSKGKYHSLYSPAIEYSDGSKYWLQNDKLHRLDGPAVERPNGYKAWYYEGKRYDYFSDDYDQEDFENDLRNEGKIASMKLSWQLNKYPYLDSNSLPISNSERRSPYYKPDEYKERQRKVIEERFPSNMKWNTVNGFLIKYLYENGKTKVNDIYEAYLDSKGYDRQRITQRRNRLDAGPKYYQMVTARLRDLTYIGYVDNVERGYYDITQLGREVYEQHSSEPTFIGKDILDHVTLSKLAWGDPEKIFKFPVALPYKELEERSDAYYKDASKTLSKIFNKFLADNNIMNVKLLSTHFIDADISDFEEESSAIFEYTLQCTRSALEELEDAIMNSSRDHLVPLFFIAYLEDSGRLIEEDVPSENEIDTNLNNITSSQKLSWGDNDFVTEETDSDDNLVRRNSKGEYHSLYSPAVERWDGIKHWYQNGKLHRLEGPAEEYPSGYKAWYYEDQVYGDSENGYTQEQFERDLKRDGIIASMKLTWQSDNNYRSYACPSEFNFRHIQDNLRLSESSLKYLTDKFLSFLKVANKRIEDQGGQRIIFRNIYPTNSNGPLREFTYYISATEPSLELLIKLLDEVSDDTRMLPKFDKNFCEAADIF